MIQNREALFLIHMVKTLERKAETMAYLEGSGSSAAIRK